MKRPLITILLISITLIAAICGCSSKQTQTSENNKVNYVTRDFTPVYSEADDTSSCIAYLDEGDFVLVMSSDGQFSKVMTSSNQQGYINNRDLSADDPMAGATTDTEPTATSSSDETISPTETSAESVESDPTPTPKPERIQCMSADPSDYHTDNRDGKEYLGSLTVDGKLDTAWNVRGGDTNNDPNTHGVGQYIDYFFPVGTKLSSIKIHPGFCDGTKTFFNNYSPTVLTISSGDKEFKVNIKAYAKNYKKAVKGYTYSFGDEWLELEDGVLTITIDSAWSKNKKWQDCCISEVYFYGVTSTDPTPKSSTDVNIDASVFPDSEFMRYVKEEVDKNQDGVLSKREIERVREIVFYDEFADGGEEEKPYHEIKSLQGMEIFSNLEKVYPSVNGELSDLDMSKNPKLKDVEFIEAFDLKNAVMRIGQSITLDTVTSVAEYQEGLTEPYFKTKDDDIVSIIPVEGSRRCSVVAKKPGKATVSFDSSFVIEVVE